MHRSLIACSLLALWSASALPVDARAADDGHVIGTPTAAHSLDAYVSLSCSYSRDFLWKVLPKLRRGQIADGSLRVTLRHLPRHDADVAAALITECVAADRFVEALDLFFEMRSTWTKDKPPWAKIKKVAGRLSLDAGSVERCLSDQRLINSVMRSRREVMERHEVEFTPFFASGDASHNGAASLRTLESLAGR